MNMVGRIYPERRGGGAKVVLAGVEQRLVG
jgi:hypothetical protein